MIDVGILLQSCDVSSVLTAMGIDWERRKSKMGYELYFKCFTSNHSEDSSSKSMSISEHGIYKGMYNCWSCNEKGNLIHMLRILGNMKFMEAVAYLERDYGSADIVGQKGLDFRLKMFKGEKQVNVELPVFELPNDYVPILQCNDSDSNNAKNWLKTDRHISDDAMRRFEIGLCSYRSIGLALVIPIRFQGEIRSIFYAQPRTGGLKRYPKNSPQGQILYNYDECINSKKYIMMESILDVIKFWSLTGEDCMACFTNMISKSQLDLLSKFNTHGVMPDLDGVRGWDLVLRMQPKTGKGLWLYFPPIGKDPGDCTPEEVSNSITNKIRYCDYENSQNLLAILKKVQKVTVIHKI